jgi:hypothetical protein
MSETLMQDGVALILGDIQAKEGRKPRAADGEQPTQDLPPVGYRWISKRWRVLPDGTRDYAAFHGKTAFNSLLPVSSRLRSSKR